VLSCIVLYCVGVVLCIACHCVVPRYRPHNGKQYHSCMQVPSRDYQAILSLHVIRLVLTSYPEAKTGVYNSHSPPDLHGVMSLPMLFCREMDLSGMRSTSVLSCGLGNRTP